MKWRTVRRRSSAGMLLTIAALTALAVVTLPFAVARYSAASTAAASARVARWEPKATAGSPKKVIFKDTSISDYKLEWKVTFDNRLSEVRASYTLLQKNFLVNENRAHSALTLPAAQVAPQLSTEETVAASNWYRWYINNQFIDANKGDDGVVWEQDFSSATLSTAFPGGSPLQFSNDHSTSIESSTKESVALTGNYFYMGSYHKDPKSTDGRIAVFNRPNDVGDNWAIEFDACFGTTASGYNTSNPPLFAFVIWDSSDTPALNNTSANWYAIGVLREKKSLYVSGGETDHSDLGVFCVKATGTNGYGGPRDNAWTNLVPRRAWGTADFAVGEKFHVRVERFGTRITLYLNGEQVLHCPRLTTGNANYKIGFYASETYAGVDNIKFYALWAPDAFNDGSTSGANEVLPPTDAGLYKRIYWDYDAVQVD